MVAKVARMRIAEIKNLTAFLLALVIFVGCGKGDNIPAGACLGNISAENRQFIDQFALYSDLNGTVGPAVEPSTGKAPFGALIAFLGDGTVSYCTATHMTSRNVLTAAHCVEDTADVNSYALVHYDQSGQRATSQIYGFWKGSSKSLDSAVLRVCPGNRDQWDTAGNNVRTESGRFTARVWSYDPIKNYSNLLSQNGGHAGMAFNPKTCNASRTVPRVKGVMPGKPLQDIKSSQVDVSEHIIMDNCNLIQGNSGSLITDAANFDAKVGDYHWGVGPSLPSDTSALNDPSSNYTSYWYLGNSGSWLNIVPTASTEFFQVGSALDHFADQLDE